MATPDAALAQGLSDLIEGYWSTQVIAAAVRLRLPDLMDTSLDAAALATRVGAHAPSLHRLLRAMQTLGLVQADGEGRFALTPAGRLLRADAEGSMRGRVLFSSGMLWDQFADLADVVRTGERGAHAPPDFESLPADRLAVFQQAMAESSLKAARDAAAVYDFGRFDKLLDVGGGFGGVLAFLLGAFPTLNGDVFDLPMVGDGARAFLAGAGLASRANFIGGDFFKAIPGGYDAYLFKYILHDWADEPALKILQSCRAAIGPDARVVILEQVVPDRLEPCFDHRAVIRGDLTMLTVGGKERTAAEYRDLLAEAGFELTAITPTASSFSVIEAKPV